jgi:multidrug efflux pump subunit AcrA (membrane-fusion protein)
MAIRHWAAFSLAASAAVFISATALCSSDARSSSKKGGTVKTAPGSTTDAATETSPSDAGGSATEIVIHRRRIHLRAPEKYQVSMHLDPARTVRLGAPFDGAVRTVLQKPGQRIDSGTEVLRMDTTEKQLKLDRAKALYKVAQLEEQSAGAEKANARELAAARLQAAKADLDLAVYWVEQGAVRAPFNCEVLRVDVAEGQTVRMGDPLATVGDTSALTVEMPIDRNATRAGQTLEIKVEDRSVPATVESILPLATRFEAIRDLVPSAASAVVVVPNTDGRLKPGQTVYSPLIPRDVVADVPNSCIANTPDGNHKVQVLRNNVVRDVPIATLAAIGADRSFISGAFDPTDEVIESASPELADGTVVRASLSAVQPQEAAKPAGPTRGRTQNTPSTPNTETPAETPTRRSGI